MELADLDTPSLLIERSVLEANVRNMQALADRHQVALRPHVKTHKMPALARMQLEAGAVGVAVAKLGEAEVMAGAGVTDIQIANEIVGPAKIARLLELARRVRISCAVDSEAGASALSAAFADAGLVLEVFIEINSGLNRCGLAEPGAVLALAQAIRDLPGLRPAGLLTHAGHIYAADPQDIPRIGTREGELPVELAGMLRDKGLDPGLVSVGSTPSVPYSAAVAGVGEIRPGNYIFNDMTQVSLGVADLSDCALSVLAQVISLPAPDRAVIDAGSKAFALDKGPHGSERISGFGRILGKRAELVRLSEEHGVIHHAGERFALGERLRIVPNHACTVANLFDCAYLVDGDKVVDRFEVTARGRSW